MKLSDLASCKPDTGYANFLFRVYELMSAGTDCECCVLWRGIFVGLLAGFLAGAAIL